MKKLLFKSVLGLVAMLVLCLQPSALIFAQSQPLSITVYVENQSPVKRADAFKTAISIAIQRLTDQPITDEQAHKEIRDFASRYVRGFRYLSKGKADVEAKRIPGVKKQLLKVDINTALLSKSLAAGNSSVTVNTSSQPLVLFWMVETTAGKRQLISAGQTSASAVALQQYTKAKGIKSILPRYDGVERNLVKTTDVTGGFERNILEASRAYNPDNVVTLNLQQLPNNTWRTVWSLLDGGQRSNWTNIGKSRTEAISAGVGQLKNVLSTQGRGSIALSGSDVLIEVQNVRSLSDFAAIEAFLDGLPSTQSALLLNINGDKAFFNIVVQSDRSTFERQVARNSRLQQVLNPASPGQQQADTTYFYQ